MEGRAPPADLDNVLEAKELLKREARTLASATQDTLRDIAAASARQVAARPNGWQSRRAMSY